MIRTMLVCAISLPFSIAGCAMYRTVEVIPDYELLSVPRPVGIWKTGAIWLSEVGTSGDPVAKTSTKSGLPRLLTSRSKVNEASVEAGIGRWVSTAIGAKRTNLIRVSLSETSHSIVDDVYGVAVNHRILFEQVIANGFRVFLDKSISGKFSIDAVKDKLSKNLPPQVNLVIASTGDYEYLVSSNVPLVVAIRIVSVTFTLDDESGTFPIDLSTVAVGKVQGPFPFGYSFILQEPVDPINKIARFKVFNEGSRSENQYAEFRQNEPWISSDRSLVKNGLHEDRAFIVWSENLRDSKLKLHRQHILVRKARSGLRGGR